MTGTVNNPIRVVDFSQVMAGPFCTRLLADVGAEVVKVEPPEGDAMRGRPPLRDGHSAYFGTLNAGKRSVVLDLKSEGGRNDAFELASGADVVVENFRPGVMERLGLGWEALSARNPRLIYCAISGFGQSGAASTRPAYAPMIHAASGHDLALMDFSPGLDRPAPTGMFYADVLAGVYAWGAIQTALLERERSGAGQLVDVGLMDSLLAMMVYECQEAQFPQPRKRHVYTPLKAADGFVMAVPLSGKNFGSLVKLLGDPEWGRDPRFQTPAGREANWAEIMARIEGWTSERSAEDCERLLMDAGVPCSRYRTVAEVMADPATVEREMMGEVEDGAGTFLAPNPPFKMSRTAAHVRRDIPALGEATKIFLGICWRQEESLCTMTSHAPATTRRPPSSAEAGRALDKRRGGLQDVLARIGTSRRFWTNVLYDARRFRKHAWMGRVGSDESRSARILSRCAFSGIRHEPQAVEAELRHGEGREAGRGSAQPKGCGRCHGNRPQHAPFMVAIQRPDEDTSFCHAGTCGRAGCGSRSRRRRNNLRNRRA